MADVKMLVDDSLLRELSAETRKVGTKVLVKKTNDTPAYAAEIMDIIIMPQSEFYRHQFMTFYYACRQNSVKALKELNKNFPFSPDYHLGIGYILNLRASVENTKPFDHIKLKSEFEIFEGTDVEIIVKKGV